MNDVMFKGGEMHLILQGRIIFLLVVGISFFFMLGMLLDAYHYYCRKMEGQIFNGKMKIMKRDSRYCHICIALYRNTDIFPAAMDVRSSSFQCVDDSDDC
jgi:hypothetical protein